MQKLNIRKAHQVEGEDAEVDLLELWRALMKGKWVVLGFTFVFSVASILYALSLPNMYTSTVMLAPVESSSGGLSAMAGELGGLASLAGINLGKGGTSKATEAIEIMKSWSFIEGFIEEQGISQYVFAVTGWSRETGELQYNSKVFDPITNQWTRDPKPDGETKPSSWELYQRFRSFVSIVEDKKTGFIKVSVEYFSPVLAQAWAGSFVEKINSAIRHRDTIEAKKNIEFLKEQVEIVAIANMQTVFYKLIEGQTKTLMLASGSDEYVFRIVNEPRVAEVRSKPKRAVVCMIGATLGGLIGSILGLVFGKMKRKGEFSEQEI